MDLISIILSVQPDQTIVYEAAAFLAALPAILSLVMAAGGTAYGVAEKSNASRKLRDESNRLFARQEGLADLYESESSKGFLDTQAGQSGIQQLMQAYNRSLAAGNNNAVSGGATGESKVAHQSGMMGKYNEALNKLSGMGTQYKMGLTDRYQKSLQGLMSGNQALNGADVKSWGNFLNNAGSSFANTMGTTDWKTLFDS